MFLIAYVGIVIEMNVSVKSADVTGMGAMAILGLTVKSVKQRK